MSPESKKLRRKTLLIDRSFQLKFSLYVCSWIFALSLVFPLIIYSLFEWIIQYSQSYLDASASTLISDVRSDVFFNLVLLEVAFIGLTFLITLFLSHKIAGPVYKLKKTLKEAKEDISSSNLRFRKADHFQDLAQIYNEFIGHVRTQKEDSVQKLSAIAEKVDRLPQDDPSVKEIAEEIKAVKQRLSF